MKTATIDAYVIALDETRDYCITEQDRPFIRQIRGVYLFDRNQQTYCCELTPSYYLRYLYTEVIPTKEGEASLHMDRLSETYEYCGGDDQYVHCRTIDASIERNEPLTVYHYGDPEVDLNDVDYDKQLEELREHLCANHVL